MLINDILKNKKIIFRLSVIDMKSTFKASILSYFWVFINPAIMVGVYLFSFFVNGTTDFESFKTPTFDAGQSLFTLSPDNFDFQNKIGWIIIGIVTWSYVGSVITAGSNSIRSYSWLVTKIGTPISTPPTLVTLSKTYVGVITILVAWIIYMITAGSMGIGKVISLNTLQLPIMIILLFLFLTFWSITWSPISAISKDIFNVLILLPVFLQWITGVFLPLAPESANGAVGIIFRLNPFNFLIDNIRGSIMGSTWMWSDAISLISFSSFFILLFGAAAFMNKRAKRVVVDLV